MSTFPVAPVARSFSKGTVIISSPGGTVKGRVRERERRARLLFIFVGRLRWPRIGYAFAQRLKKAFPAFTGRWILAAYDETDPLPFLALGHPRNPC